MSESAQTRLFCRTIEKQGAMTYPLIAGAWAPEGWPDRLIVYHGEFGTWHGCLEFKSLRGRLKPLQANVIAHLRKRMLPVFVARLVSDETKIVLEYPNGIQLWHGRAWRFDHVLAALCCVKEHGDDFVPTWNTVTSQWEGYHDSRA